MSLRYAYNTNGLAHHRLDDALSFLADTGYDGVALTLDVHHFDPFATDAHRQAERLRARLGELGLGVMVETGARFLLDPRHKHEPTLVTADAEGRARRLEYLRLACNLADTLGAEAVSFWTGVPRGVDRDEAWRWVLDGVKALLDTHGDGPYALAVEPEPGMLVEDADDWARLHADIPGVTLALDTGHCVVSGNYEPHEAVREFARHLGTVAVEGMRRGVHDHLPLDEGDVDLPALLSALTEVGYDRLVTLELSRDSHRAHEMVPRACAGNPATRPPNLHRWNLHRRRFRSRSLRRHAKTAPATTLIRFHGRSLTTCPARPGGRRVLQHVDPGEALSVGLTAVAPGRGVLTEALRRGTGRSGRGASGAQDRSLDDSVLGALQGVGVDGPTHGDALPSAAPMRVPAAPNVDSRTADDTAPNADPAARRALIASD